MSDFLDKLAAAPLANPIKVFQVPGNKRPRRRRSPAELEDFRAERAAKKERLEREHDERVDALLAYYAATDVPLDRVASHLGIDEDAARGGLARHGRLEP